ncbi:MAG: pyruvate dehydrogenase complex dihydrolipoamide acetyltransferase [Rhodospirillaceae bacterium]|nr:pyruvate dehydrogenase complex dihydrolipoamide acetyltransferase [Rhodospirillaceae bacterium]
MPIEILMPALSPTMTEGKLSRWVKKEGDRLKSGDVVAEIETDKAVMEVETIDEGVLGRILVPEGTAGVKVNQVLALILEEGEAASALDAPPARSPIAAPPMTAAVPAAPQPQPARPEQAQPSSAGTGRTKIFASPLARRLAHEAGLDLAGITGSGPRGRIIKSDIEAALKAPRQAAAMPPPVPAAAPVSAKPAAVAPPFGPAFVEEPLSSMRRVIATRLSESKSTIPHFYLTVDCVADKLLALRSDLNGRSKDYKLSINDFIIRAAALALRKVPAVNASFAGDSIRRYTDVDVSVAVATGSGLITPIIHHADHKGLATIAAESKALIAKAQEGKLRPEEFQGGSFSISNLGMMGAREFAAIINPPQAAILAIGSVEPRPVVRSGELAVATVMSCTLSADHRVVDGATGAEFMSVFKALIEEPLTMLL